jgi:hypothetical protein
LTPISYGLVGLGDQLVNVGEREALWLNNDGDTAHNVVIGPVKLGDWVLTFEPPPAITKGRLARVLVFSICKPGPSGANTQMMRLDNAWMDVSKAQGPFERVGFPLSYTDFYGNKFSAACAIVRDPNIRGNPFRLESVDTSSTP